MSSALQHQSVNLPRRHDPHNPKSTAGKAFLHAYRPVYQAFGFKKGYNFPLYLVTVGALMGFILARLQFLNIEGTLFENVIPGEAFWYQTGHRRVGIIIHLIGVLLGGFLACLQFTPIIRHKAIWLHRICGYLAIALFLLGNAGAFMILDHSVGGSPVIQVWLAVLGIGTTVGIILAFINTKRLQIDQHRAWMIRTWAWAACIISLRLILLAGQHVVYTYNFHFYTPIRCDEIYFMYATIAGIPAEENPTSQLYPTCGANAVSNAVEVTVSSIGEGPENAAVSLRLLFIMAGWLALTIHAVLAELYLWLTPAESYRLRVVSYEKQVTRGLRRRGEYKDAGLGSTRLGDAPEWWSLSTADYRMVKQDAAELQYINFKPGYEQQMGQPDVPAQLQRDESEDSGVTVSANERHLS